MHANTNEQAGKNRRKKNEKSNKNRKEIVFPQNSDWLIFPNKKLQKKNRYF